MTDKILNFFRERRYSLFHLWCWMFFMSAVLRGDWFIAGCCFITSMFLNLKFDKHRDELVGKKEKKEG